MKATFKTEAELCAAFIAVLPEKWRAYPETGGFDILLVHDDGTQIGIEAKLVLNAKVVSQAVEGGGYWSSCHSGPDYRAVLVPWGKTGSMERVCDLLCLTVIEMASEDIREHVRYRGNGCMFYPELPTSTGWYWGYQRWHDWCPGERIKLPEYQPDVQAGRSAPLQLTQWKIKAIKLVILLERRGYVTRKDILHFEMDPGRWLNPGVGWLQMRERGVYVAGPHTPDFRAQHPVNYEQIAADFEHWKPQDASDLFAGAA